MRVVIAAVDILVPEELLDCANLELIPWNNLEE